MRSGPAPENLVATISERCRSGLEPDALRAAVLPRLRRVVPIDALWWAHVDPTTLLFTQAYREETESAPAFVVDELRATWQARLDRIRNDGAAGDAEGEIDYRALRRELIDIEAAELTRLFEVGEITDGTRRRIQRLLDLEHVGLED